LTFSFCSLMCSLIHYSFHLLTAHKVSTMCRPDAKHWSYEQKLPPAYKKSQYSLGGRFRNGSLKCNGLSALFVWESP
jgi:hypothetical protein